MSTSDDGGPALPGHAAEKPEGTTPASDRKANPLWNGSAWGRRALDGIRQLHQDEEARKEVARRLFWTGVIARSTDKVSALHTNYAVTTRYQYAI
jgi:hypothetical protein